MQEDEDKDHSSLKDGYVSFFFLLLIKCCGRGDVHD